MANFDMSDYVDVPERIRNFRERYPEGTLQSEILESPQPGFVVVKAYAYRTPDDPRPGVGLAWEPFPGKTPYTKDSELQNAETSAWGRAIIAVGASDAKRIASAEEVRNRRADSAPPAVATTQQLADLNAVLTEFGEVLGDETERNAREWVLSNYKVASFEELTAASADHAIAALTRRVANAKAEKVAQEQAA